VNDHTAKRYTLNAHALSGEGSHHKVSIFEAKRCAAGVGLGCREFTSRPALFAIPTESPLRASLNVGGPMGSNGARSLRPSAGCVRVGATVALNTPFARGQGTPLGRVGPVAPFRISSYLCFPRLCMAWRTPGFRLLFAVEQRVACSKRRYHTR
jgi:hypothetical protein